MVADCTTTGTTTLTNVTVSGNSASDGGGGVYNHGGTVTIDNGTISGNSDDFGGGVYNHEGTVTIDNGTISGNSASSDGGGLYTYDGVARVDNCHFTGNTAGVTGGAISIAFGQVSISGCTSTVTRPTPLAGRSASTPALTIENSSVTGNTSLYEGGGLWVYNGGMLTTKDVTVSGNSAVLGGGIYSNGTVTVSGSTFTGNTGDGLDLLGSGNLVAGNFIGTNAAGSGGMGNSGIGIYIYGNSDNDTIGGTTAGAGNVISGNSGTELVIDGSGNLVAGNRIGTNPAGSAALAGGGDGIDVYSSDNTIGGSVAGAANVISGNTALGLYLDGTGATGNLIQGNFIGTDATGTVALGNLAQGVYLAGGASDNIIGTDGNGTGRGERDLRQRLRRRFHHQRRDDRQRGRRQLHRHQRRRHRALGNGGAAGVRITGGAQGNLIGTEGGGVSGNLGRNVISGNANSGVQIDGAGTSQNVVAGNDIGTDVSGQFAIPNGMGIYLEAGVTDNTIGGLATTPGTGAGNVISGNTNAGVDITGTGTAGNVVVGNLIGTNAAGTAALANVQDGILIQSGGSNNTIGGGQAARATSSRAIKDSAAW